MGSKNIDGWYIKLQLELCIQYGIPSIVITVPSKERIIDVLESDQYEYYHRGLKGVGIEVNDIQIMFVERKISI